MPKCLEDSPTAKWWAEYYAAGGQQSDLVVHIEKGGDYDGLAVAWGINNKKASAEECAAQCLTHKPSKELGAAGYSVSWLGSLPDSCAKICMQWQGATNTAGGVVWGGIFPGLG